MAGDLLLVLVLSLALPCLVFPCAQTPNTRIWFVTTGYLVRLLAHKLPAFARYTHLVIDEIHERSLDCDLLCYLAKRLLHVYPHIKIVLMSATAHSAMFQTYFNSSQEAIFVGVRRFPLTVSFAEDLYPLLSQSGQKSLSRLLEAVNRCANKRSIGEVVPDYVVKEQLQVQ
jgi:HrpA-like RNA helicase